MVYNLAKLYKNAINFIGRYNILHGERVLIMMSDGRWFENSPNPKSAYRDLALRLLHQPFHQMSD